MLELRATAEARLGEEFDIRAFHDELGRRCHTTGCPGVANDGLNMIARRVCCSATAFRLSHLLRQIQAPFGVAHATTYKFDGSSEHGGSRRRVRIIVVPLNLFDQAYPPTSVS